MWWPLRLPRPLRQPTWIVVADIPSAAVGAIVEKLLPNATVSQVEFYADVTHAVWTTLLFANYSCVSYLDASYYAAMRFKKQTAHALGNVPFIEDNLAVNRLILYDEHIHKRFDITKTY